MDPDDSPVRSRPLVVPVTHSPHSLRTSQEMAASGVQRTLSWG